MKCKTEPAPSACFQFFRLVEKTSVTMGPNSILYWTILTFLTVLPEFFFSLLSNFWLEAKRGIICNLIELTLVGRSYRVSHFEMFLLN